MKIEVFGESEDNLAPKNKEPARFHENSTNRFNIFLSYSSDDKDEANKIFGDVQANNGKMRIVGSRLDLGHFGLTNGSSRPR